MKSFNQFYIKRTQICIEQLRQQQLAHQRTISNPIGVLCMGLLVAGICIDDLLISYDLTNLIVLCISILVAIGGGITSLFFRHQWLQKLQNLPAEEAKAQQLITEMHKQARAKGDYWSASPGECIAMGLAVVCSVFSSPVLVYILVNLFNPQFIGQFHGPDKFFFIFGWTGLAILFWGVGLLGCWKLIRWRLIKRAEIGQPMAITGRAITCTPYKSGTLLLFRFDKETEQLLFVSKTKYKQLAWRIGQQMSIIYFPSTERVLAVQPLPQQVTMPQVPSQSRPVMPTALARYFKRIHPRNRRYWARKRQKR
jgi:hypothetical protein